MIYNYRKESIKIVLEIFILSATLDGKHALFSHFQSLEPLYPFLTILC
jgi:hypothetical protein